jgi:hypothetical protein
MTDQQQHRATPEQWENMEEYRDDGYDDGYASCILELRDRIAALEAAQASTAPTAPSPAGSLVERVRRLIADDAPCSHSNARAAIREVASWLRSELVSRAVADRLDQEAKR